MEPPRGAPAPYNNGVGSYTQPHAARDPHKHHRSGSGSKPEARGHAGSSRAQHGGSSASRKPPPAPPPAANLQPLHQTLDKRLRRDTPFLATIRFKNDLPEVPGDPKLLMSQPTPEKLAAFGLTTLETEPKQALILPPDLGIPLSLLDMERYAAPKLGRTTLHPADLVLLGAEADSLLLPSGAVAPGVAKPGLGLGSGSPATVPRRGTALRSAAEVSWLMRTTYISGDAEATRTRQHANEFEARRKKALDAGVAAGGAGAGDGGPEDEEALRQEQLRAIEATFAASRAPPVHRTKPTMRAVEVLEVLPDVEWWGHSARVAHFDIDPTQEVAGLAALPQEQARQVVGCSFLRGFRLADDDAQQKEDAAKAKPGDEGRCLALVVPKETLQAPQTVAELASKGRTPEEVQGAYHWSREYTFEVVKRADAERSSAPGQQTYVMHFTDGKALYCELSSYMEMHNRRKGRRFQKPSQVTIQQRGPTEREEAEVHKRRRVLQPGLGDGLDGELLADLG